MATILQHESTTDPATTVFYTHLFLEIRSDLNLLLIVNWKLESVWGTVITPTHKIVLCN